MAIGEGSPSTIERVKTKTEAIAAITIWLPTKEPTRAMIAFVKWPTRSRRLAGTREKS